MKTPTPTEHKRLFDDLRLLESELSDSFRKEFQRHLPFPDMVFDRWERARRLGWGERTSVYQDSFVLGDVAVGKDTWVGPFTILDGTGGLTIGDHCSISAGVQIYTHDTVQKRLTGGKIGPEKAPTAIEDFCYIGPLAVITKGVKIGHHSVVGAHALVREDVEPYSVVFGVPAKKRGVVKIGEDGRAAIEHFPAGNGLEALEHRIEALESRLSEPSVWLKEASR